MHYVSRNLILPPFYSLRNVCPGLITPPRPYSQRLQPWKVRFGIYRAPFPPCHHFHESETVFELFSFPRNVAGGNFLIPAANMDISALNYVLTAKNEEISIGSFLISCENRRRNFLIRIYCTVTGMYVGKRQQDAPG